MFSRQLGSTLKARGLSQAWLVKRSGLSKSVVSRLISGEQEPRYSQVKVCADALEMHPGDFFEGHRHSGFEPIVTKLTLLRPLYEDPAGRLFVHSVYVHEDSEVDDIRTGMSGKFYHSVYLVHGDVYWNGRKLEEGVVMDSKITIPTHVKVMRGSQYVVMTVSDEPTTMRDVMNRWRIP